MGNKEIDRRDDDAGRCMVKGCVKRALYRNASSNRCNGTQRGYCRDHKQRATESQSSLSGRIDDFSDWLER